jgi:UDP-GlcNAc:undecaprenyl-phosphate/decaprenyl-phosphate GlcNAc-1-phosphate transferase
VIFLWLILGSLLPSLLITWAAAFAIRRFGPRLGMVDSPGHRKVHSKPMPTCGGLAVWLGVMLPFAAGQIVLLLLVGNDGKLLAWQLPQGITEHLPGLVYQSGKLWALLGGGTVLMILGMVDDIRGLNWKTRIAIQSLVALVLVLCGWQLQAFIAAPWFTIPLSVFWIVGLVNSFNMLDNMDGLSAGVAAIAAAMLAAVMLLAPDPVTNQPQIFVGGFLLVVVGALLGFLWHNRPPARLFMGDAGSYLIGYLIAMATLTASFAGYQEVPPHAILAPLCVLAVPIYDTLTVVTIRLRQGRSPFEGDKSHFSHRLVELGMTKAQAVGTIYLTTATCGLGALLLHQVNLAGAAVILLLVGCVLVLIGILETTGRHNADDNQDEGDGTK